MKKLSYLIIPLLLLGCSADPVEEEDANLPTHLNVETQFSAPRTAVPGTINESWMSDCFGDWHHGSNVAYLSYHIYQTNHGEIVRIHYDRHITDNTSVEQMPCHEKTSGYTREVEHFEYVARNEGMFELTSRDFIDITPLSEDAVNDYNLIKKCGFDDWELNVRKDIQNSECSFVKGTKLYCHYDLNMNTGFLYIKCDETEYLENLSDVIHLRNLKDF